MTAIKATVRNGRIETASPIDWPDGTELIVRQSSTAEDEDAFFDDTPEGIKKWLEWYDSLEPILTDEDFASTIGQLRKEQKEWELANSDKREAKLLRMFK